MAKYTIIENTPGYLPDVHEDDLSFFDSYSEALNELARYNKELAEEMDTLGMPEGGVNKYRVEAIVNGQFSYYDNEKEPKYDLGRNVEIVRIPSEGDEEE